MAAAVAEAGVAPFNGPDGLLAGVPPHPEQPPGPETLARPQHGVIDFLPGICAGRASAGSPCAFRTARRDGGRARHPDQSSAARLKPNREAGAVTALAARPGRPRVGPGLARRPARRYGSFRGSPGCAGNRDAPSRGGQRRLCQLAPCPAAPLTRGEVAPAPALPEALHLLVTVTAAGRHVPRRGAARAAPEARPSQARALRRARAGCRPASGRRRPYGDWASRRAPGRKAQAVLDQGDHMQERQAEALRGLRATVARGRELAQVCAFRARLAEHEPVGYTLSPLAEALLGAASPLLGPGGGQERSRAQGNAARRTVP
jgi:hypothetical protein